MKPEMIIKACIERQIDRLFVTDHNVASGAFKMAEMAPDLVIPGQEILTTRGELLAFFINEEVPAHLPPLETIARLRAQGSVISVPHPFDPYRKGHWTDVDLRVILPHVDAIEVFNARCFSQSVNERASAWARKEEKLCTVGSDAHSYRELGRATLCMKPFSGPEEFLDGLKTATFDTRLSSPMIHLTSSWAKMLKTLQ